MKIVIEIPEKTNAHIRSDYGHGMKGLFDEDREILCDAIYNGTPYVDRPHGEWVFKHNSSDIWCSNCDENFEEIPQKFLFCPKCGSDNRPRENNSSSMIINGKYSENVEYGTRVEIQKKGGE